MTLLAALLPRRDHEEYRLNEDESRSLELGKNLNAASVTTPATRHRLDVVRDDLGLFNAEVATHAVVMKRSNGRRFDDVKTRQIATRVAAIPVSHEFTVLELFTTHS